MATMAQQLVAGSKRERETEERKGSSVHDLAATDLANRLAELNLSHEIADQRRPQQGRAISQTSAGAYLTTGTTAAGTTYTLTGTIQAGFSFDHIVSSYADWSTGNWGLIDLAIESYTFGGNTPVAGPFDVMAVNQFVQRSLAPLTQEDGKLKQQVNVNLTVYCWVASNFHGIYFMGTDVGKRCALKRQFVEPEPQGPAALLRDLKRSGFNPRTMMSQLTGKLGARFGEVMGRLGL
jgi:hypothetical protein